MLHRKNRSRKKFLSTPSARRATNIPAGAYQNGEFLSTPSARRATKLWGRSCRFHLISIHALREESDLLHLFIQPSRPLFLSTPSARRATPLLTLPCIWCYISIHALREESDVLFGLPVPCCSANFYPRPPRGERRSRRIADCAPFAISIHALREEGDRWTSGITLTITIFLSTPSARRATLCPPLIPRWKGYFYPRPPRGGRPIMPGRLVSVHCIFLSTPSARRATNTAADAQAKAATFLSTPSARRATSLPSTMYSSFWNFYPRPPRGGRLCAPRPPARTGWISIHALREEGDLA